MSGIVMEKRKHDCIGLPSGWLREETVRKTGLNAGKIDVNYYSPNGKRFSSKPELSRYLGETVDLSTFDFQTGKVNPVLLRKSKKQRSSQFDYSLMNCSRGVRNDASLVPPIRQTASIFKQPVTVIRNFPGVVKNDLKIGAHDKPRQLFWEKRLQSMRACDLIGEELKAIRLPDVLKAVGPNVSDETLLQSIATALHVSSQPITGQGGPKAALDKNPGVFLNPEQPLMEVDIVVRNGTLFSV